MGQNPLSREAIVLEIRRCADQNGGVAVGRARFTARTGIREADWLGRYWATWSDAVGRRGSHLNQLQGRYADEVLLEALAALARDLGHNPREPEIRMRRQPTPASRATARSSTSACRRAPRAPSPVLRLVLRVRRRSRGARHAIRRCRGGRAARRARQWRRGAYGTASSTSWRVGKHYKVGRSLDFGRRSREIDLQLPERAERVHAIRTDDPVGVERYWHERFAARRLNGEWFLLTKSDVAAFKRWRSIAWPVTGGAAAAPRSSIVGTQRRAYDERTTAESAQGAAGRRTSCPPLGPSLLLRGPVVGLFRLLLFPLAALTLAASFDALGRAAPPGGHLLGHDGRPSARRPWRGRTVVGAVVRPVVVLQGAGLGLVLATRATPGQWGVELALAVAYVALGALVPARRPAAREQVSRVPQERRPEERQEAQPGAGHPQEDPGGACHARTAPRRGVPR